MLFLRTSRTNSIVDLTQKGNDGQTSKLAQSESRKRSFDCEEDRTAKRQHRDLTPPTAIVNAPTLDHQYVYLATAEEWGAEMDIQQRVLEVYACVEDATQRLEVWQDEQNREDWKDGYDKDGCWNSVSEDAEGDGYSLSVQRMLVRPAGSAPPFPERESSDESELEEHSGDSGSEEPSDESGPEERSEIRARYQMPNSRRGGPVNCRGCGCGDPRCTSCAFE